MPNLLFIMSKAVKILDKMRANNKNWRIEDIQVIAKHFAVDCRHGSGSHYVFGASDIEEAVCIPNHKPVKEFYIKRFIHFIDKAIELHEQYNNADYQTALSF